MADVKELEKKVSDLDNKISVLRVDRKEMAAIFKKSGDDLIKMKKEVRVARSELLIEKAKQAKIDQEKQAEANKKAEKGKDK